MAATTKIRKGEMTRIWEGGASYFVFELGIWRVARGTCRTRSWIRLRFWWASRTIPSCSASSCQNLTATFEIPRFTSTTAEYEAPRVRDSDGPQRQQNLTTVVSMPEGRFQCSTTCYCFCKFFFLLIICSINLELLNTYIGNNILPLFFH